jgi:hypothetical protein
MKPLHTLNRNMEDTATATLRTATVRERSSRGRESAAANGERPKTVPSRSRYGRPLAQGLVAVIAIAAAGCSSVDPTEGVLVKGPKFGTDGASFRPISSVLERRCGTLDCHGSTYRPLKIYGQVGLRRPEVMGSPNVTSFKDYYSGGPEPTTGAELLDNYRSAIGLEPEITDLVVAGRSQPDALTLVRKPRLREKHKGGLIWNQSDPGDLCLVNWLTGSDDTTPCDQELSHK